MAPKRQVLSHHFRADHASLKVELRIDEGELSLVVTSPVELAFCLTALGRRHCLEAPQNVPTTVLSIYRGNPCRAYLEKPGHSVEIPTDEVLPLLRTIDLPLLWPEAEVAIAEFIARP
jgi:hypothetical protein